MAVSKELAGDGGARLSTMDRFERGDRLLKPNKALGRSALFAEEVSEIAIAAAKVDLKCRDVGVLRRQMNMNVASRRKLFGSAVSVTSVSQEESQIVVN